MAPVIAERVALAEDELDDSLEDETDHRDDTVDETVGGGQPLSDRAAPIVIPSPVPAAAAEPVLGQPATAAAGGLGRSPKPPQALSGGAKRRNPLVVVLAGLVVAGIVGFGLTQVLGGSDSSSPTNTASSAGGSGGSSGGPGAVVAVLNATPINGLAGQVSAELAKDGFRKGRIATAGNQQQANTVVAYMPGHAVDAEDVAKSLGVKGNVVAADDKVQAIACPDPSTCTAQVIVTVGADSTR
jgi:hypothetical protein